MYIEAGKSLQLSRNINTFERQVRDVTSASSQDDVSSLERGVTQMAEEVEKSEERVRDISSPIPYMYMYRTSSCKPPRVA